MNTKRLIIGISGASGAIYGVRILEALHKSDVESHLIISKAAHITIKQELDMSVRDVENMAHVVHNPLDIAASISSGSFKTSGMIIAPCSIKTMSEIASGVTSSLLTRAADVVLKEKRRLLLGVRETPFNAIHLTNMKRLAQAGAVIAPPLPAFYIKPQTINDMVNHTVGRWLDMFDIETDLVKRWCGLD